ncbi:MAG: ubiquinone biosynthesis protein UbiJ [Flavobacteriales bacterium]|jgi:ubiquinone biosynthesis protein UbiJ
MLDPSISTAFAKLIELSLNKALDLDPGTRYKLRAFGSKIIALELSQPQLNLYIETCTTEIIVRAHNDNDSQPADLKLSGKCQSAFMFLFSKRQHTLAESGLKARGNTQLLAELKQLCADIDLDWEQALADTLGNTGSVIVSSGIKSAFKFGNELIRNFEDHAQTMLSDEFQLICHQHEVDTFLSDIDVLRSRVERVSQRAQKLQSRLN